jgi:hypothetical protein
MRIPTWPFVLSIPASSCFALVWIPYATGETVTIGFLLIWLVAILALIFGASATIGSAMNGVRVPLPRLPKRLTRYEKRVGALRSDRIDVLAERDALPEDHPHREPLQRLGDVLAERIAMEEEEERNKRFVKVTKKAYKTLESE